MRLWLSTAFWMIGAGSTLVALPARAATPQDITFTARHDGSEQRYVLLVPDGMTPETPVPVLIALHGHGSDRWQFVKDGRDECRAARDAAARHGMLYVSPDYRAKTSWMGPSAEADMLQIIADLKTRFRISKVVVCGGSMGGTAALTLAGLHPDQIDGVVSMNGTANLVEYAQFQDAIAASFGGSKQEVPEEYRRRSAELQADRLSMPIAWTTGGRDTLVPPESVLRLASRLEQQQRPVRLIHRPAGGHDTNYADATAAFDFVLTRVLAPGATVPAGPPLAIGSRRELFVDDTLIDRLAGKAELRLHHPVPREVVLEHDAPWEGSGCVYHSIFRDGDRFRMYYAAGHLDVSEQGVDAGTHGLFCCYAESDDGVHWRKPNLGLHAFQGSTANNIVMVHQKVGTATSEPGEPAVFKDENPAAPADARYKALLPASRLPDDHRRGLLAFKSADGLHWSPLSDQPILNAGAFDSQNLAFWDAERGEYRAYWRYFTKGGYDDARIWNPQGDRAIRTATSRNFLDWTNQQDLQYVDSPSEQLYTSQVKPYHRAPHLLIGFPLQYVERGHQDGPDHEAREPAGPDRLRRWSASLRALPEFENRQWRAKTSERYGRTITEGLFMASRDGVKFKRWNEGFLRPGLERPGTWNYGHQFIAWHPIETHSDLDGAPHELSLFAVESYWTGRSDLLRRYTLRLDGFVSVQAPRSGGELVTRPLTFTGRTLSLNFATSAAGSVRVELQDADGRPCPGLGLDDCEELFGDTLDRPVVWKSQPDLAQLAGRPVRLRFVLRDADVFSFQFRE